MVLTDLVVSLSTFFFDASFLVVFFVGFGGGVGAAVDDVVAVVDDDVVVEGVDDVVVEGVAGNDEDVCEVGDERDDDEVEGEDVIGCCCVLFVALSPLLPLSFSLSFSLSLSLSLSDF